MNDFDADRLLALVRDEAPPHWRLRLEGERVVVAYAGPYVVGAIVADRPTVPMDKLATRVVARLEEAVKYCRDNGERCEVYRVADPTDDEDEA